MSNRIDIEISEIRREEGRKSLMAFAKACFPDLTDKPFSRFHVETCSLLERAVSERGSRLAIAAPRGHAKSTFISLFYPLWAACYGHERYIVIFSGTERLARELMGHIAREIKRNPRLRRDFPDVIGRAKCRRDMITLGNGVVIAGASVGQEVRGLRSAQGRPSLIIADDVEMTEHYRSREGRERVQEWFFGTVTPMGNADPNVVVTGTIHHRDALMAHLTSPDEYPGWEKRIYRAVEAFAVHEEPWDEWRAILSKRSSFEGKDGKIGARLFFERHKPLMLEGTSVLWEHQESYYDLELYIAANGRHSFDAEKQNRPVDPEAGHFPPRLRIFWMKTFGDLAGLRKYLGDHIIVLGACDPSTGKGRDYSGIVIAFKDARNGTLYVVRTVRGRWDLKQLGEQIAVLHKEFRFHSFAFEENAFQLGWAHAIQDDLRRAGVSLPLKPVKNSSNKEGRILRLQPFVNGGVIQFPGDSQVLDDELTFFPKAENDDLVDALSMLFDLAEGSVYDPAAFSKALEKAAGAEKPTIIAPLPGKGPVDLHKEGLGWLINGYK